MKSTELEQMIGTRGDRWIYPALTLAGRTYTKPCSTITLPHGKFVVRDPSQSEVERTETIQRILKSIEPGSNRKKKTEVSDD